MSNVSVNDCRLAKAFGFNTAFEFWSNYSRQTSGTLFDHANSALTTSGYTGTLDDKITAWLSDMAGVTGTQMDNYTALLNTPFYGLTFFKNYASLPTGTVTSAQLNANLSAGSPTATFTATRSASAPATYVDDNGVVKLVTTSDVGRIQGGYYDATGFHANKGLMIEGAGTNLMDDSYVDGTFSTYWTNTGATSFEQVSDQSPPYGTKCIKFVGSDANDRFYKAAGHRPSISNATVYTASCFMKGSGDVYIRQDQTTDVDSSKITLTSDWRRYSLTFTSDTTTADIAIILKEAQAVTCYATCFQIEKSPCATSFIPTTTAALSRGAEVLKYETSGNRTNATETCFIRYSPSWAGASQTSAVKLIDTDADIIDMAFVVASDSFAYSPNVTDSVGTTALADSDPAINTKYVMAGVSYGATAGTNAEIYVDGVTKGTSTTNYTEPEIGTYFYVGSKSDGSLQTNGIVDSVAFFSTAKSATEVASITDILER